jgi:hypothetical protein
MRKPTATSDDTFLENLLAESASLQQPPSGEQQRQSSTNTHPFPKPRSVRLRSRRFPALRGGMYEKARHKIGVSIAMIVVACLWLLGAFFTLTFLETLGFTIDFSALGWWLIPIAISALEVGLQPDEVKSSGARIIWLIVLAMDIATTAIGIHAFGNEWGLRMPAINYWFLAVSIGFELALAPEPLMRSLWGELRR